ncbi:MAG: TraR/DksA C4-type zinc finger protein [Akkermansiaceae bacterium]|jgi:RNA polymerase-binding transcription factor DksA|nr:TraR/DksA C4-type zinc finger protein [Akkermansiaceae bacterium]
MAAKKTAKSAAKKATAPKAAKTEVKKPAAAAKAPAKASAEEVAEAPKPSKKAVTKAPAPEPKAEAPAPKPTPKVPVKVDLSKLPPFVAKQRQRLLDLRDELVDAMSGVTGEIRNGPEGSEASGSGMHQGDAGSDAYDRDFALSVLAKEQDALYEIEQALRRIDRGVYGVCEMSGEKIPHARLEAIPFARLTVQCQAEWEKEYGNQRYRPKGEVGFSNGYLGDDEESGSVSLDEEDN